MFKIQYPRPERALWLYHQNIHKYTRELRWNPGLHWVGTLASTPTPTSKGNSVRLRPFVLKIYRYSANLSGGQRLCSMLRLVSAANSLCKCKQPPCVLVPVSSPCEYSIKPRTPRPVRAARKINYHGNEGLLRSDQFAVAAWAYSMLALLVLHNRRHYGIVVKNYCLNIQPQNQRFKKM